VRYRAELLSFSVKWYWYERTNEDLPEKLESFKVIQGHMN